MLKGERTNKHAYLGVIIRTRKPTPFDKRTSRADSSILLQVPGPYTCLLPPSPVSPSRKGCKRLEAGQAPPRLRHVSGGGKSTPEGERRLDHEDAQVRLSLKCYLPTVGSCTAAVALHVVSARRRMSWCRCCLVAQYTDVGVVSASLFRHRVEGKWVLSLSSVGTTMEYAASFVRSRPCGSDGTCRLIGATGKSRGGRD